MDATEQKQRLHEAIRDFLWDQWVALGLAGHATSAPVPFVVDPEALLLATFRFAIDSGRFRSEVFDWLSKNGGLLSVQKIKNLQSATQMAPPEGLRDLSVFMQATGYRNWKSLDTVALSATSPDNNFPISDRRGLSQAPDPARPEAFLLRMRMVFGVNARADVFTWLLTHSSGHAAGIARETGWFSKSVQLILNDLEQADIVVSQSEGKRKVFSLHRSTHLWHPELGSGLSWFGQAMFYLGVRHVLRSLETATNLELSYPARSIIIHRDLVALQTAFRLAGLGDIYGSAHREQGETLVKNFEERTSHLLEILKSRTFSGK